MSPALVLFDIDQTLLNTGGAGIKGLHNAFAEVFDLNQDEHPELDLAGATDLGLLRDFGFQRNIAVTDELTARFFDTYVGHLEHHLAASDDGRVLPGVVNLLETLSARPDEFIVGLLTGNIRRGAEAKLNHFGLSSFFNTNLGSYGDDHFDRNLLGPIAKQRVTGITGHAIADQRILVIGDTPKDIRCAHACNVRCLAVASGNFTAEQLAEHGADHVFEDLTNTAAVLELL
ncbi:HAD family hydrolase [Sulfuriroseicoccus oceanibius]|uniref:phosphoglycolate phosphatase n=1 Tax=Sulfuriroseicoccus oceanibius TaxID=2707525 RepID=A0A6B3LFF5_9BACT|nr:HAD hydrolase-like protein [Sulfuriroseicoccus oceanibius]QQL45714.1 HAD hydrolase-like protein [Sulfuriroseicoccus oceanibius]